MTADAESLSGIIPACVGHLCDVVIRCRYASFLEADSLSKRPVTEVSVG